MTLYSQGSCCNNESTTTRIETRSDRASKIILCVAIMNPLQQGLKHLTPSSNAGYKLSCNNESTTTRIETNTVPEADHQSSLGCNNESTTTRIETLHHHHGPTRQDCCNNESTTTRIETDHIPYTAGVEVELQ